jgi:uncharacterized membrane protein YeaQ/YmgE (transglycosylase-associated protein family)
MGLLAFIVFGFFVGLLARLLMPGRDAMGLIATSLLGIVGSLVGWWIGALVGFYRADGSRVHSAGFFMSVLGAILVLAVAHAVRGRRHWRLGGW